jgi:hypothetical protein
MVGFALPLLSPTELERPQPAPEGAVFVSLCAFWNQRGLPAEAALLRLMFQLGEEPFAAPKLHGMAVN